MAVPRRRKSASFAKPPKVYCHSPRHVQTYLLGISNNLVVNNKLLKLAQKKNLHPVTSERLERVRSRLRVVVDESATEAATVPALIMESLRHRITQLTTDRTTPRRSDDATGKQPRLSPLYQYLPIENIRLLSVEEVDGRLVYSLETFRKDEVPEYDALSYCWGEDVRSSSIVCNGHTLDITPCLSSALQEVLKFEKGHRPLWVDAICLNQRDEDEKAIHVLQMYSIFTNASQVVVWLGDADAETPEVILQMERILQKLKEAELQKVSRFLDDHEVLNHGLPSISDQIWRSIGRLLHRP